MNREEFWDMIERTRHQNTEQQYSNIGKILSSLPTEDVLRFWQYVSLYAEHSESPATYIACKLLNHYASDDTELYFRCWLVAQGKETFFGTLKNIDYLADLDLTVGPPYEFEMLAYLPVMILDERGEDIDSLMETNVISDAERADIMAEIETDGEWGDDEFHLWEQASVRAPRLWSKFHNVR